MPGANGAGQDVTISFSQSVTDIVFTVTDIDNLTDAWSDRIIVLNAATLGFSYTIPVGGLVVGAGTAGDRIRNSNANLNLPNSDNRGNAIMSFTGPLTSLVLRYVNGPITGGNNQLIRISDITFRIC